MNEREDLAGELAPPVTLTDREQLLARVMASQVLEGLEPGCASMVIPAWVVDELREAGKYGGYVMQSPLCLQAGTVVMMKSHITPDGSIHLELDVNGQYRVWTGVLRGPAGGA